MARSYLFPGQDVEHLSPYQRQLERLYDQTDRPGRRLSPEQFFQSQEYLGFVNQQYGSIPIPPGVQVLSQSPTEVRYRDQDGYEHVLRRDVAGGREGGQVVERTDRPAILPNQQSADLTQSLGGGVNALATQQLNNLQAVARGENVAALDPGVAPYLAQIAELSTRLSQPVQLAALDPATRAALDAQSAAEQAALDQQFNDARGQLVADLYGNRVNQSTIANDAVARLVQQQGLVRQQQQSDAALRGLQVQLNLTEEERNRLNSALSGLASAAGTQLGAFTAKQSAGQGQFDALSRLLSELSGQQTTRDVANAGYTLDAKKLDESTRQFNAANSLDALRTQIEQERLDQERGPLSTALKIGQLAATLSGAGGTGVKAYREATAPR